MTTAELERHARAVVPQAGTTGWRISAEGSDYAVVPVIGGRLDGRPVFRGVQRDAIAMHALLSGVPTSRRAHAIPAPEAASEPRHLGEGRPDLALAETPEPVRLCAGCDEPLPEGSRPNRTTHDAACRQRAQYRREAEARGADADSAEANLTLSGGLWAGGVS